MKTPVRPIRIPNESWSALERIGKDLDRTASYLTRQAIEEFIARYRAAKRESKAKSK